VIDKPSTRPTAAARKVQDFVAKELHSLLFLEEFTFARTQFTPPASSEVELADAVVLLGDVLLIYQIKERNPVDAGDEEAERKWFQKTVLKHGTKQIRDTLGYLQSAPKIMVPNERGRVFDLAAGRFSQITKVVIYRPSRHLPADCRAIRHYQSRTGGFIHVVEAQDYLEIGRTLRVPREVVNYFGYREAAITQFAEVANLPEPAIAGHFVGGDLSVAPNLTSVDYLHRLVQDAEQWDLAPLLRGLHEHLTFPGADNDYYEILIEIGKLPRSGWRALKERFVLAIQKTHAGKFVLPYRFVEHSTGCGFIVIPAMPEAGKLSKEDLVCGLRNFTVAHKYDQRLDKCVGVIVNWDGEAFDILWALISHEWVHDPEIEAWLARSNPLRPVKPATVHGYKLTE